MKMRLVLVVFFFLCEVLGCIAQKPANVCSSKEVFFKNHFYSFVHRAEETGLDHGSHHVYTAHMNAQSSADFELCIALCYIQNEYSLEFIHTPKYILGIRDELLLLSGEVDECFINDSNVVAWSEDSELKVRVMQRLVPSAIGGITGINQAMLMCYGTEKQSALSFDDSAYLPRNMSGVNEDAFGELIIEKLLGSEITSPTLYPDKTTRFKYEDGEYLQAFEILDRSNDYIRFKAASFDKATLETLEFEGMALSTAKSADENDRVKYVYSGECKLTIEVEAASAEWVKIYSSNCKASEQSKIPIASRGHMYRLSMESQ